MKLVKVGGFGINIDSIATWVPGIDPDRTEEHAILDIRFVAGGLLTLRDEPATALRRWLEAHAEDVSALPSASEDRAVEERPLWVESQRDEA